MSTPWERRAAARSQYIAPLPLSPRQQADERRKDQASALDAERLALERERLRIAQEEADRKVREDQANAAKLDQSRSDAQSSLYDVLSQLDRVETDVTSNGNNLDGFGETGTSGALFRGIPGSAAYDLQRKLDMIDANAAFDRLQRMRDNSPTGGALGAVSAPELQLLKSSIASLDPNQSQDEFVRAVRQARNVYARNLDNIGGAAPGASLGSMIGTQGAPRAQGATPSPPRAPSNTTWYGAPRNAPRRQSTQSAWGKARVID